MSGRVHKEHVLVLQVFPAAANSRHTPDAADVPDHKVKKLSEKCRNGEKVLEASLLVFFC